MPIAEEAAANAAGDTTEADVIRRETLALLDTAIGNVGNAEMGAEIRRALADTKDKLIRGEIDDTKACNIAEYTRKQLQEGNSDRVLDSL